MSQGIGGLSARRVTVGTLAWAGVDWPRVGRAHRRGLFWEAEAEGRHKHTHVLLRPSAGFMYTIVPPGVGTSCTFRFSPTPCQNDAGCRKYSVITSQPPRWPVFEPDRLLQLNRSAQRAPMAPSKHIAALQALAPGGPHICICYKPYICADSYATHTCSPILISIHNSGC